MALPSQTERTAEMSRPVMTRTGGQGGPPNKMVLGVVTLVLAAGAVYGIMRLLPGGSTGPSDAQAKPIASAPKATTPPPKNIAPTPGIANNGGPPPAPPPPPHTPAIPR